MTIDPLDLDTLIGNVLAMYDESPPGVQAKVEREAADIRVTFRERGLPLTIETIRAHVMLIMFAGITAGIEPVPSPAADALGTRVAGTCLLFRAVKEG